MEIGFFGEMGERLGREIAHELASGVTTIAGLRRSLAAAHPDHAEALLSPRIKAFVSDELAHETTSLAGVARVEFLPPLSGG